MAEIRQIASAANPLADWNSARRATGYRVKIKVPGEPQPRGYQPSLGMLDTSLLLASREWARGM